MHNNITTVPLVYPVVEMLVLVYHSGPWLLCPLLLFSGSTLNKDDVVDTVDLTDAIVCACVCVCACMTQMFICKENMQLTVVQLCKLLSTRLKITAYDQENKLAEKSLHSPHLASYTACLH